MLEHKNEHAKRVRNLVIMFALSAIVFSVSTYAWFVGMRTVNVSNFDVEIAGTESLALSLNGENWNSSVTISSNTFKSASYEGNTNSWAGTGLMPVSSIGEMDATNSRMKLYEKASFTTTAGGYRIMASRIANNTDPEADPVNGYVAFDLFVRNYSGTQYIPDLRPADEEAIYLTRDSAVSVASTGVENTGIENSVRVAFAQIGRVIGTENDESIIAGISCNNTKDGDDKPVVTGICRNAQIWEPNDKKHEANAIRWYANSCKARTGLDVSVSASYSGTCGTVADGTAYPTYAVKEPIASGDNVDVYDGAEYNTYAATTKLYKFPYFTDTMKNLKGTERPTFMTLAPNSITKIRVYVYIEGQDVDNYDFASIGKKISVKFGLSKERFTDEDIHYNGPGGLEGESSAYTPAN
jgi:hypothetical protein